VQQAAPIVSAAGIAQVASRCLGQRERSVDHDLEAGLDREAEQRACGAVPERVRFAHEPGADQPDAHVLHVILLRATVCKRAPNRKDAQPQRRQGAKNGRKGLF
jgi:hypothetical protein